MTKTEEEKKKEEEKLHYDSTVSKKNSQVEEFIDGFEKFTQEIQDFIATKD